MPIKSKFFPKNPTKYIGDPNKIICRSSWERRFCIFLDKTESVKRWSFETLKIPYLSPKDNDIHIYYPDFIVEKRGFDGKTKTLVIEIKPHKQTKEPKKRRSTRSMIQESMAYSINTAKWEESFAQNMIGSSCY